MRSDAGGFHPEFCKPRLPKQTKPYIVGAQPFDVLAGAWASTRLNGSASIARNLLNSSNASQN
jgi:hypothetical protein